jgi:protocadherin-16/23
VVTVLRANDIDLSPQVTYRLDRPNDYFSLDTYTGQLILLKRPSEDADAVAMKPIKLSVLASDTVHEARTKVEIAFTENGRRCRPDFSQPIYSFFASSNDSFPLSVGAVKVVACENNSDISFEVERKDQGRFSVLSNGTVVLNRLPYGDADSFVLTATDERSRRKATAVVVVTKSTGNGAQAVQFAQDSDDTISLVGSADPATPVTKIRTNVDPADGLFFSISRNPYFEVDSATGDVYNIYDGQNATGGAKEVTVTVRHLTNKQQAKSKTFRIVGHGSGGASHTSANRFSTSQVETALKENEPTKTTVNICPVLSSTTSNAFVKIISGNAGNVFKYDEKQRKLVLAKPLDYERQRLHNIVLKMGTSGDEFSLCKVTVHVKDVNDNKPMFPACAKEFATTLPENSPVGSRVPGPPVVDLDGDDQLHFWITNSRQFDVDADSGALSTKAVFDFEVSTAHRLVLHVNDTAGHRAECNVLVLVGSVDEYPPAFEQSNYYFALSGLASGSPGDVVGQVRARDRDRGPDGIVTFSLAAPSSYFAIDALRGVITVSKTLDTGVFDGENVIRRRKRSLRDITLAVMASSKQPKSLDATAIIAISVEENLLPVAVRDSGEASVGWVTGVIVALLLVAIAIFIAAFFFCRKKMLKKAEQRKYGTSLMTNASSAGNVNNGMSASNSMELSSNGNGGTRTDPSRFPPQYSEIITDYGSGSGNSASAKTKSMAANSKSEISEKSHRSASSGRGSVEDGDEEVDSEIRMINEGSCYLSAAAAATDMVPGGAANAVEQQDKSDAGSVQNTEDYLARLGIDIRKPPNMNMSGAGGSHHGGHGGSHQGGSHHGGAAVDMVHNFSGSQYGGGSSIYNRIADDAMSDKNSVLSAKHSSSVIYGAATGRVGGGRQPSLTGSLSSIVHSEEELAGSYNWDYLLDWGPQYQSLSHVFKEISRLKDDSEGGGVGQQATRTVNSLSVSATGANGGGATPSRYASVQPGFPSPSSMPPPPLSSSYGVSGLGKNPHTSHLHHHHQHLRAARSPISHDMLTSQNALSPNFHPSLSPLATKSPSVSPMGVSMGAGSGQQQPPQHLQQQRVRAVNMGNLQRL